MGWIVVYPPTPLAVPAAAHAVRVHGVPIGVERYAGISVARFAMHGAVEVEVEVAGTIGGHAIFPAERASAVRVDGPIVRFVLTEPESVVVWIDELEKLFVLPDPLQDREPDPRSAFVIDVVERGADPTGEQLATVPLQSAIDDAARRPGGGTVVIPPGRFRTGTLSLGSNVTLDLAAGALLQGSADPADYPVDPGRRESAGDASLPPDARYLGRTMTFSRLLLIDRADNVRITGRGTIDGEGTLLRAQHGAAPNLLRVRQSSRVVIEDVLFRNAAAWSLHVVASRDVTIRNVKVINDRANLNTDGIDVDMSSDVSIDRAFIHTKDDAVCVKATGNGGLTGDPARIKVTNSLVSSLDAGLKIGSETAARAITDVVFEHDFVFDTGRAMSIVVRDGATVERVTFRAIEIGPNVDHLIEQVIGVRDPDSALGAIHDLTFDDVSIAGYTPPASNWTWYAQFRPGRPAPDAVVSVFEGADETHAVVGLRLTDVVVNGRRLDNAAAAATIANLTIGPHVRNVTFD